VVGAAAKVTETIDNENTAGAVYVDGKTWTARSADGSVIPAGTLVEVRRIEGVKLIVAASEKKAEAGV
jgi:membrane protein implicated in regulation of membrane protease activity